MGRAVILPALVWALCHDTLVKFVQNKDFSRTFHYGSQPSDDDHNTSSQTLICIWPSSLQAGWHLTVLTFHAQLNTVHCASAWTKQLGPCRLISDVFSMCLCEHVYMCQRQRCHAASSDPSSSGPLAEWIAALRNGTKREKKVTFYSDYFAHTWHFIEFSDFPSFPLLLIIYAYNDFIRLLKVAQLQFWSANRKVFVPISKKLYIYWLLKVHSWCSLLEFIVIIVILSKSRATWGPVKGLSCFSFFSFMSVFSPSSWRTLWSAGVKTAM